MKELHTREINIMKKAITTTDPANNSQTFKKIKGV
jgi:hypothetical protein